MTPQRMLMARNPRTALALCVSSGALIGFTLSGHACGSRAVAVYTPGAEVQSEALTARPSGLRVGELSESGALDAGQIWDAADRTDRFLRFVSGSKESQSVVRTMRHTEEGTLVVELAMEAESAVAGRSELAQADSGEILIVSNSANKIDSRFDPRALFLPPRLEAGQEHTREIRVSSTGPMFGSGEGEGTSVVRGIGTQRVEVPAGVFEAFVFESELAFSVGPARIELTQRAWVDTAEGRMGIVAEEGKETVKVFGLSVHSETRVGLLDQAGVTAE